MGRVGEGQVNFRGMSGQSIGAGLTLRHLGGSMHKIVYRSFFPLFYIFRFTNVKNFDAILLEI